MNRINNAFLKSIANELELQEDDFTTIMEKMNPKFQIPINIDPNEHSIMKWSISEHFQIRYDYEGCEKDFTARLFSSELNATKEVYVEFGYDTPVVKVATSVFINNWYSFIGASGYLGATIVDVEGNLVLEFSDDNETMLRSNFKI